MVSQIPTIWLPIGFLQGFIRVNYVCTNYSLHTTNSSARGEGVRMSGMQLPHELTVLELGRMGRDGHPIAMYKPIKLFENEKNEDFRYYA